MIPLMSVFDVDFIRIDFQTGCPMIRIVIHPDHDEYVEFFLIPIDDSVNTCIKIIVDGTIRFQIVTEPMLPSLLKELKTIPQIFFSCLTCLNSILGNPDLFREATEESLGFPPAMIPVLTKYHDMFLEWENALHTEIMRLSK